MKRKEFISTGISTGAIAASGIAAEPKAAQEKLPPFEKVPRKELGTTGEKIPTLVLGCAQSFNARYDKILHRCFKEGVDYLDTALVYAKGMSQKTIAPFIGQVKRKNLWITSKAPHHGNKANVESYEKDFETCLQDLKTDYLDLFFMHALDNPKYLDKEYLQMGERLKKQKKTRFFGFSCHGGNVVELMNKAAKTGGIDAIMFRYHFGKYGDKELNVAIDNCKKAGIGLIAMKTMKSVPDEMERVLKFKSKDFSLSQAKLKAVWMDERIDSVVSHIDNMEKLKENVAAAKSRTTIAYSELQQLRQFSGCTDPYYCDGCSFKCEPHIKGGTNVADTLRYLMYFESYGLKEKARELYSMLNPNERTLEGIDFSRASSVCPQGIDIEERLSLARELLA